MIAKSLLGIFLVILLVSVSEQAPKRGRENRPELSHRVEEFLQNLDHDGLSDSEKIKYLGEILIALSYYKYNNPNYLEHCVGRKIVQDGYRDVQRQPYRDHNSSSSSSSFDGSDTLPSRRYQNRGIDGHQSNADHQEDNHYENEEHEEEDQDYDDQDYHNRAQQEEDPVNQFYGQSGGRNYIAADDEEHDGDDQAYTRDYGHDQDGGSRGGIDQESSYDPYQRSHHSSADQYDHSGDYDNSPQQHHQSGGQSVLPRVDEYLNQIQLHGIPSNLLAHALTYLDHAKGSVRSYASRAQDFDKIRPCFEPLVRYFNILNEHLAGEYRRCSDQCYMNALHNYSSSISQYTHTTTSCISDRV